MRRKLTGEAREVVSRAYVHARLLGHRSLDSEHLLYGLAGAGGPVGAVLREQGVTPARVAAASARLSGPADGLDREALTMIGIDLDTVQQRVEATFGPGALTASRPVRRRRRITPTPQLKRCLKVSRHWAAEAGGTVDAEHLALAVLTPGARTPDTPARILGDLGISPPRLRDEIQARCRHDRP